MCAICKSKCHYMRNLMQMSLLCVRGNKRVSLTQFLKICGDSTPHATCTRTCVCAAKDTARHHARHVLGTRITLAETQHMAFSAWLRRQSNNAYSRGLKEIQTSQSGSTVNWLTVPTSVWSGGSARAKACSTRPTHTRLSSMERSLPAAGNERAQYFSGRVRRP